MRSLSAYLHTISKGWVAFAALLIFLIFIVSVLPFQATKAGRISGSAGSPDTSFSYSASELYAMAQSYGEAGRQAYIRARWTFDLIFPLVYGVFLITSISWLSRRLFGSGSFEAYANLLPLLGMLFDYLENSAASIVMARFPSEIEWVAHLATIFTPIKWMFVFGSFVVLMLMFQAEVRRSIRDLLA